MYYTTAIAKLIRVITHVCKYVHTYISSYIKLNIPDVGLVNMIDAVELDTIEVTV